MLENFREKIMLEMKVERWKNFLPKEEKQHLGLRKQSENKTQKSGVADKLHISGVVHVMLD